ncbi:MAG: DUF3786 domain-containing protein [Deltaproteobacteria bacterium]|nr:DUF3786 domain-containing protein [Deltaproteobacteria bacterium]
MPRLNNPMEILKILDKSNCRECGESTCLAFAAKVFNGQLELGQCSHLDREIIGRFGGKTEKRANIEQDMEESMEQLKRKIHTIDLASAAGRLGAEFSNNRLTLRVLGKNFGIDSKGNLFSEIHIHAWIAIPILNYIIDGKGIPVSGKWVPFRELKGGKDWYRLFGQRCEKPLKKVADTYTGLFEDMLHIFNGKQVKNHYSSDISLVLHPLPKVPILICYWKPEDDLESSLNLFFDSTAEENLNIASIYALGSGLVTMFEKISLRHGHK